MPAPVHSGWKKRLAVRCAGGSRAPARQMQEEAAQVLPAPARGAVGLHCNTRPFSFHAPLCYKYMAQAELVEQKNPPGFWPGG